MDKKFYFLSGLPRSGNTLLSSILNQNPKIYSSGISPIVEYLWRSHNISLTDTDALRPSSYNHNNNLLKNIIKTYYLDVEKEIIFDRNKGWGNTSNTDLIKKYIDKKPKIIFTVRPIIEILASYITITEKAQTLEDYMEKTNWAYKYNLSLNDNKCDFLMRPWGGIDYSIASFSEFKHNKDLSMFHIVEYKDLIDNPDKTMENIYTFLEIDNYQHNFKNIIKIEDDGDLMLGYPEDLHKVEKKLIMSKINPYDILSEYAINKYSNMEFWR
jgi:sulfotransferase